MGEGFWKSLQSGDVHRESKFTIADAQRIVDVESVQFNIVPRDKGVPVDWRRATCSGSVADAANKQLAIGATSSAASVFRVSRRFTCSSILSSAHHFWALLDTAAQAKHNTTNLARWLPTSMRCARAE